MTNRSVDEAIEKFKKCPTQVWFHSVTTSRNPTTPSAPQWAHYMWYVTWRRATVMLIMLVKYI